MKHSNEKGFNLTEMVFAIVIIAGLTGLAIPNLLRAIEHSRAGEGVQFLTAMREAQLLHRMEYGSLADSWNDLDRVLDQPAGDLQYFTLPTDTEINSVDPIAQIIRMGNLYTLSITQDGTLTCADGVGQCAKAGF